MLVLLFLVLLVITFLVVLFATRQTKEETALGKRLAGYDRTTTGDPIIDADILKRDAYSDLPIVDDLLRRMKVATSVDTLIKQANSNWTVGTLVFASFSIFAIVCAAGWKYFHSIPAGLIFGLIAGNGPYFYLVVKRNARMKKFESVLPDAIDLLGRALRAGHAVTAAIEMVSKEIPDPVGSKTLACRFAKHS